jgi:large subunit ribosomal protein L10
MMNREAKKNYIEEMKKVSGPTAAAVSSDPFLSARILHKFSKKNDKLKIVAGFMEGKVIDQAEVAKIASLPTLSEARAKIVGVLAAPAQKIISILLAQSKKMASLAPVEEKK